MVVFLQVCGKKCGFNVHINHVIGNSLNQLYIDHAVKVLLINIVNMSFYVKSGMCFPRKRNDTAPFIYFKRGTRSIIF